MTVIFRCPESHIVPFPLSTRGEEVHLSRSLVHEVVHGALATRARAYVVLKSDKILHVTDR